LASTDFRSTDVARPIPVVATARLGDCEVVEMADKKENVQNYKGFVAGVFSGIAKLTGAFTASPFSCIISSFKDPNADLL